MDEDGTGYDIRKRLLTTNNYEYIGAETDHARTIISALRVLGRDGMGVLIDPAFTRTL